MRWLGAILSFAAGSFSFGGSISLGARTTEDLLFRVSSGVAAVAICTFRIRTADLRQTITVHARTLVYNHQPFLPITV